MSLPIPGAIKANATAILGAALALSVAGNLFLWNSMTNAWAKAGAFEVALDTQKQESREAKAANDNLVVTIDGLVADKQALVAQMTADLQQAQHEWQTRDEKILKTHRLALERLRKRDELTKTPTCRDFLDGIVGNFCPEYAERLRQRTRDPADSVRDADDIGAGAGVSGAATTAN